MTSALTLTPLEQEVLNELLLGDYPPLAELRQQVPVAWVVERELTGVGFFTTLAVPRDAARARLPRTDVRLTGADAEIEGLEHGAGFVLYITDGALDVLEGFSYDEPWPDHSDNFKVSQSRERKDIAELAGLASDIREH